MHVRAFMYKLFIVGGGRGYKGKLRFGGFPPVFACMHLYVFRKRSFCFFSKKEESPHLFCIVETGLWKGANRISKLLPTHNPMRFRGKPERCPPVVRAHL